MINLSCILLTFFSQKKVLINIHVYANELICIFSYYIKGQCLFFHFVPHSLIFIEYRLRYDHSVKILF